jgi:DNA-binding MarR family transcriptional regulator
MNYKKAAAEFLERKPPNGHAHPPFEKYQMFTKGERFALFHLMHVSGRATPGEIAEATNTSTARVAVILKSLEAKGYIRREIDRSDRRKVLIFITEKGHDIIKKEQEYLVKMIASIFRRMGERDTKEFLRLIDKFFGHMCKEEIHH